MWWFSKLLNSRTSARAQENYGVVYVGGSGETTADKNYPQQAECRFMGVCSKVCDLRIRNLKWLDFLLKLLLQHHYSNSLFTSVAFNWVPPNHKYTLIYNTSKTVMDYLAYFLYSLCVISFHTGPVVRQGCWHKGRDPGRLHQEDWHDDTAPLRCAQLNTAHFWQSCC